MNQPKMIFKDIDEARKYLKKWQHLLRLDDWYITISLEKSVKLNGEAVQGLNICERTTRQAHIQIREFFEGRDDHYPKRYCAEAILVHELLHLVYNFPRELKTYSDEFLDTWEHQQLDKLADILMVVHYGVDPEFFLNKEDGSAFGL